MGFQDLLNNIDDNNNVPSKPLENPAPAANTGLVPVENSNKPVVDLSKFSQEDIQALDKLKSGIDITQSNSINSFGADVQSSIAKFADGILDGVKTKDTGGIGQNLTTLLTTMQGIDLEKLQEKQSFINRIPLLKSLANSASSAKIMLENVTETVDKIVVALDTARKELVRDVNVLDALYNKNLEYLHHLELCIAAGELKYNELSGSVLLELRSKAEQTQDMLDIQRFNDFSQMLNEMEKRIHDLKLSREIAIQTLPQIRIIQGNDKILASKIQASVLTTIPIWKNQIALTISLNKQKTALELQKKVSDTTEDLLKKNAELLKMNSIEIARESERGVVSIETLKETHQKLMETIEESVKIYQDGRQKRSQVEAELSSLEETQKQRLLSMRSK